MVSTDGRPGARTHDERDLARSVFATGPSRLASWAVLPDDDALKPALVADLRTALVDYPRDRGLTDLVEPTALRQRGVRPTAGRGCDIRLVVHTVAAGSTDAEKLEFLRVTGGARAEGSSPPGSGLFAMP